MPNDDAWNASGDATNVPPLPREARVFRRRAHLIDAAVREMADHGYGGATVASITARAGLSDQAFYEQFPSKEDALVHAYDVAAAFAVPRIFKAMRAADDWQQAAVAALATYLAILDCDHAWALVCLQETTTASERVRQARDALRAPIVEALERLTAGDGPGPVPVHAVLAGLDAIAVDGLRHRPGQPLAARQRELARFVLAPLSDGTMPDELDLPPRRSPHGSDRVDALIDQGDEGTQSLGLLVRAAIARRDGPTLWRVIVGLQRRQAQGHAVDQDVIAAALGGIRDAWFFGLLDDANKW